MPTRHMLKNVVVVFCSLYATDTDIQQLRRVIEVETPWGPLWGQLISLLDNKCGGGSGTTHKHKTVLMDSRGKNNVIVTT